jgi:hypothetical protein
MVLCPLPHRLQDVRLREEEFDVVICPRVGGEALEKNDHFLRRVINTSCERKTM